jgi:predicted RNA-binding protein with PUA-like domain
MKAEQVDRMETLKNGREFNTKFTIDDLKEKGGPEPWEGVRNMVARNNMRAMKLGDLAFFYASQGKHPGITGIIEIVKEHEPDFTVTDENSIGFVEPGKRSKENQWSLVHVEFRKKLSEPGTLKQLQKFSSDKGVLKDMQVLKQSRLSVAKVSEKEWNFIVDELIEGYEGEGDEDLRDEVDDVKPVPNLDGGGHAVEGANAAEDDGLVGVGGEAMKEDVDAEDEPLDVVDAEEPEIGLPLDNTSLPTALMDAEVAEFPTSGTEVPPNTHATSRPTSCGEAGIGSRPVSRAGSRAANSRQGSVVPPPVVQTTEEIITSVAFTESIVEPARPGSRGSRPGALKPASRASSRGPSRAASLQPAAARGSSREPSARAGRDKTPNPAMMPSLMESMTDG